MLNFFAVVGIGTPQPLTSRRVYPPPPGSGGEGHTRWRERGWESPNADEGTYTVVLLYIYVLRGLKPFQVDMSGHRGSFKPVKYRVDRMLGFLSS